MTYPAPTPAESEAARSTAESDAPTSATKPGPTPSATARYAAHGAAGLNTTPETLERRRHRAGDLTCFWRRTRLQFVAALAVVIVGCAFGYVVAGNDHRMQIFLSATVAVELFFLFSGFRIAAEP